MKANYNNRKIWITPALKKSINKQKTDYISNLKKHPALQNEKNYKQYKRLLSRTQNAIIMMVYLT